MEKLANRDNVVPLNRTQLFSLSLTFLFFFGRRICVKSIRSIAYTKTICEIVKTQFFIFQFSLLLSSFLLHVNRNSSPTRDPSFNSRVGKAISENEIESSLPAEPEQRSGKLYDMAIDAFNNFLASHSLQIKFPSETSQEVSRAIDEGKEESEICSYFILS